MFATNVRLYKSKGMGVSVMKKMMMIVALMVLVGSNFFGNSLLSVMAEEPEETVMHCYYKSIQIEQGDSLWSIAEEYSATTSFTIPEYINQIKQMNGLREDVIHAGQHLTVMYRVPAE